MKTVCVHYNITQDDLDCLSELANNCCGADDHYWKKAENFTSNILHKPIDDLSDVQKAWIEYILERIQK